MSEHTVFNFDALSAKLIPASGQEANEGVLNVKAYRAPDFKGLESWINSKPQTMEGLKGKVVLVDFWTYSCINCIRTQPYLKAWDETYGKTGEFEIIGVHAPEFAFERNPENVKAAAQKAGLKYPIALDNDFSTWNAFKNQYWPASYLIDKEGNVRRYHGGEGEYKETEQAIRTLLAENGGTVPGETTDALRGQASTNDNQTPETYLGTKRASNYVGSPALSRGEKRYTPAPLTRVNNWTLSGTWEASSEGIIAKQAGTLKFRVAAKDVYFVTGNQNNNAKIEVLLDGRPISQTGNAGSDVSDSMITVGPAQLYRAAQFTQLRTDSTLELRVPDGVQLNVFTFGG